MIQFIQILIFLLIWYFFKVYKHYKKCTIRCKLGEKILDLFATKEIESFKKKGKSVNKSYMVFVTKLSNLLLEAASKRTQVNEYLQNIKNWTEYVDNYLNPQNIKENMKLGENKENTDKIEIEDNILYFSFVLILIFH